MPSGAKPTANEHFIPRMYLRNFSEFKGSNRPQAVAFPLSSRLLLYLFPAEIVDPIARNCFIRLSKEQIDDFCWNTAVFARNWIYSKTPFTDEQLTLIFDARGKLQNTSAGK